MDRGEGLLEGGVWPMEYRVHKNFIHMLLNYQLLLTKVSQPVWLGGPCTCRYFNTGVRQSDFLQRLRGRDHATPPSGWNHPSPTHYTSSRGEGQEVGSPAQLGWSQERRQPCLVQHETPDQTPSHALPCLLKILG